MSAEQIIIELLESMKTAMQRGDWRVDGGCDPDLAMRRAEEYLKERGYVADGLTGTEYIKE